MADIANSGAGVKRPSSAVLKSEADRQNAPALDVDKAVAFLQALPTRYIHLNFLNPRDGMINGRSYKRAADSIANLRRELVRANEELELNVYFTAADIKPLNKSHRKARKDEVECCYFLHVDAEPDKLLRGTAYEADKAKLRARIEADPNPPTILIDTGNGLSCYWQLAEPTKDIAAVEARNIALRDKFQGDNCQDACHVMRLPYTVNYATRAKIERGRPVTSQASVLAHEELWSYRLDDFPAIELPPAVVSASGRASDAREPEVADSVDLSRIDDADLLKLIKGGAPDSADRSKEAYKVACAMRAYGYADAEITAVLINPDYPISDTFYDQIERSGRTVEAQAWRVIEDMNAEAIPRGNVDPGHDFADDPAEANVVPAEEMERRRQQTEQRRKLKEAQAEPETWLSLRSGWVYVGQQKRFVRVRDGMLWDTEAFARYFGNIEVPDKKRGENIASFIFSRKRGEALPLFDTFTYRPGLGQSVNGALNLYTPTDIIAAKGDTTLWNSHLEFLLPDETDRNHLLNWIAWVLQNLHRKPKHALVIAGEIQGTGKSFVGDVLERLVGQQNTTPVDQTMLELDHNGWALHTKLTICEEVRATGANGRDAISKKLHRGITQPRLTVDEKNMPPVTIDDVMAYLLFTNKLDAIPMDNSDRRYLILRTLATLRSNAYYCNLFDTILDGPESPHMLGAIMWELLHRDLKGYTAASAAPFTAAKGEMIEAALPDIEHWMVQHADDRPLNLRVVTIEEVIKILPRRLHRTARLEWMVGDVLRRRFQGISHKSQIRPWGADSDKVRVWSINGVPPDDLVGAYREKHPRPPSPAAEFDQE